MHLGTFLPKGSSKLLEGVGHLRFMTNTGPHRGIPGFWIIRWGGWTNTTPSDLAPVLVSVSAFGFTFALALASGFVQFIVHVKRSAIKVFSIYMVFAVCFYFKRKRKFKVYMIYQRQGLKGHHQMPVYREYNVNNVKIIEFCVYYIFFGFLTWFFQISSLHAIQDVMSQQLVIFT